VFLECIENRKDIPKNGECQRRQEVARKAYILLQEDLDKIPTLLTSLNEKLPPLNKRLAKITENEENEGEGGGDGGNKENRDQ
jgi:hypothetical protein